MLCLWLKHKCLESSLAQCIHLVTQLVKNPPSMQESQVPFLSWEDLMEKGKATHSSILGLPWWLSW